MIDEFSVLESIDYLRRFLTASEKAVVIKQCSLCQCNCDIAKASENELPNQIRTFFSIPNNDIVCSHPFEEPITQNDYSSLYVNQAKEVQIKMNVKNTEENLPHICEIKEIKSEPLTELEKEIMESIPSTTTRTTTTTAKVTTAVVPSTKSINQCMENKNKAKISTVPCLHYQCKGNKLMSKQYSLFTKDKCSENQIGAELVYGESNKVTPLLLPEVDCKQDSTTQLHLTQVNSASIVNTQETESMKSDTSHNTETENILQSEITTIQSEKHTASSTHIINDKCFRNNEQNQIILATTIEPKHDLSVNHHNNNNLSSLEILDTQHEQDNTSSVKTYKEPATLPSPSNSSHLPNLLTYRDKSNWCKEQNECYTLKASSQLLTHPLEEEKNEEPQVFSSVKMLNRTEAPVSNINKDNLNRDSDKNECESNTTSRTSTPNCIHEPEHEEVNVETSLRKCEEQPSLSVHYCPSEHTTSTTEPPPPLSSFSSSSSTSSSLAIPLPRQRSVKEETKFAANESKANKCTDSEAKEDISKTEQTEQVINNRLAKLEILDGVNGERKDSCNDISASNNNNYNNNMLSTKTKFSHNDDNNGVNYELVPTSHEQIPEAEPHNIELLQNNKSNKQPDAILTEEMLEPLSLMTHDLNKEESNAPITLTTPELMQTGSATRLAQENTLSQLWQLLHRGSILLKHVRCNRRPHKRFFCIQNVKCYFEGNKAIVPHLIWRSANRRETEKITRMIKRQSHSETNSKQNNGDGSRISINERRSVTSSAFCTSGNPFRSEHLLNLTTLSTCEELREETLHDKTSEAHRLFAIRNGCVVDDHWHALPCSACAIWTFTTRTLAVSFCNGNDHELWQRAMNNIVWRNRRLFN